MWKARTNRRGRGAVFALCKTCKLTSLFVVSATQTLGLFDATSWRASLLTLVCPGGRGVGQGERLRCHSTPRYHCWRLEEEQARPDIWLARFAIGNCMASAGVCRSGRANAALAGRKLAGGRTADIWCRSSCDVWLTTAELTRCVHEYPRCTLSMLPMIWSGSKALVQVRADLCSQLIDGAVWWSKCSALVDSVTSDTETMRQAVLLRI